PPGPRRPGGLAGATPSCLRYRALRSLHLRGFAESTPLGRRRRLGGRNPASRSPERPPLTGRGGLIQSSYLRLTARPPASDGSPSMINITYFKRFRMEIDLNPLPPVTNLPEGYFWVPWDEGLLEPHAAVKFRSFCDEIDS